MSEEKPVRLSQLVKEVNVSLEHIVEYLKSSGIEGIADANTKIPAEAVGMVRRHFSKDAALKAEATKVAMPKPNSASDNSSARRATREEEVFVPQPRKTTPIIPGPTAATPTAPAPAAPPVAVVSAPVEPPIEAPAPAAVAPVVEEKPTPVVEPAPAPVAEAAPAPIVAEEKPAAPPSPEPEPVKPVAQEVADSSEKASPVVPVATDAMAAQEVAAAPASPSDAPLEDKPSLPGLKVVGKIDVSNFGKGKPAKAEAPKGGDKSPKGKGGDKPAESKPAQQKSNNPSAKAPVATPAPKAEAKPTTPQPAATEAAATTPPTTPPTVDASSAEGENLGVIEAKADQLKGLTVLGKIDLSTIKRPGAGGNAASDGEKRKRERKRMQPGTRTGNTPGGNAGGANTGGQGGNRPGGPGGNRPGGPGGNRTGGPGGNRPGGPYRGGNQQGQPANNGPRAELTDKEIQDQIKATLARLGASGPGNSRAGIQRGRQHRRDKRSANADARDEAMRREMEEAKTLKVSEFVSANDLASLMDVSVNEVISTCMSLGMFVSINQRLDAELIVLIAEEFGYKVEFIGAEDKEEEDEIVDSPEDLAFRAPIVTIMGHVDHGKTSLLDYIRKTKVVASEAGGITQHIGAYDVETSTGKRITFLDTPGHEAFTAMRARGAKVTDIAIIVVAADDNVMPQTKEAINHAQNAGVPIVIAINKIDKPAANPDNIKQELSQLNILVEDWGGKYQCEHVSAKSGQGIDELLEKVLLEAEILDLKANPNRAAQGTVIEASLDKGRGYVSTMLVQTGTLQVGDVLACGAHFGKVKAMFDHRGKKVKQAGPSEPVLVLGLNGAPQAGDRFTVEDTEREAREKANRREQILREQSIRTRKHLTLDDIGRRRAMGNFKELNIIIKGDVDGSVEALSDSLLKLSTGEVEVKIVHKAVGQITESDILLAAASDSIVIGFQVRPSTGARKIAEQEDIEIRTYSIIYDAINDIKDAMVGMLAPKFEEHITGTAEIRVVYKISKIGNVAGCMVTDGTIGRKNQIRIVRDGIVIHTGEFDALKRMKDDASEVRQGYECGMSFKNYNDILEGDTVEAFEMREIKRTGLNDGK